MLDAGHGGSDPGAVYKGRQEKDDTLKLTLAVGKILEDNGIDVVYTRTEDIYQTPFEKASLANEAGADYFISFHRNSSPEDNQYQGVEVLLYDKKGVKYDMAENILGALGELGFREIGVKERPGLVVLRRTNMPALLVETIHYMTRNLMRLRKLLPEQFWEHLQERQLKIRCITECRPEHSETEKMQTGCFTGLRSRDILPI